MRSRAGVLCFVLFDMHQYTGSTPAYSKAMSALRLLGSLFGGALRLLLLEPLHASSGVHNLVRARIERVTLAADFYIQFGFR